MKKITFILLFFTFIFIALTVFIEQSDGALRIDRVIHDSVSTVHTQLYTKTLLFITHFGASSLVIFLSGILVIIFWKYKQLHLAVILIVSVGGGEILVTIIKHLVTRSRPPVADMLTAASGYAFPSGHSFVAVSFYGLLIYFLYSYLKNKLVRYLILCAGLALILFIGFSRIYLGVHWFTDVLGSYLLGLCWLIGSIAFSEKYQKNIKNSCSLFLKKGE